MRDDIPRGSKPTKSNWGPTIERNSLPRFRIWSIPPAPGPPGLNSIGPRYSSDSAEHSAGKRISAMAAFLPRGFAWSNGTCKSYWDISILDLSFNMTLRCRLETDKQACTLVFFITSVPVQLVLWGDLSTVISGISYSNEHMDPLCPTRTATMGPLLISHPRGCALIGTKSQDADRARREKQSTRR